MQEPVTSLTGSKDFRKRGKQEVELSFMVILLLHIKEVNMSYWGHHLFKIK